MFKKHIDVLLSKAIYTTDENGIIIANIDGYSGYYTQGDNFEEARANLIDLIETMIFDDIRSGKIDIKDFISKNEIEYA